MMCVEIDILILLRDFDRVIAIAGQKKVELPHLTKPKNHTLQDQSPEAEDKL